MSQRRTTTTASAARSGQRSPFAPIVPPAYDPSTTARRGSFQSPIHGAPPTSQHPPAAQHKKAISPERAALGLRSPTVATVRQSPLKRDVSKITAPEGSPSKKVRAQEEASRKRKGEPHPIVV